MWKNKPFNLIIVEGDEEEKEISEIEEGTEEVQSGISVNALMGSKSKTTLKVRGNVGKRKLNILIDSGSTSSFVNANTAHELNCVMEEAVPWIVTVADRGNQ